MRGDDGLLDLDPGRLPDLDDLFMAIRLDVIVMLF